MLIMENFHILVSIDDIRVTVGENPIEFMLIPAFGIWRGFHIICDKTRANTKCEKPVLIIMMVWKNHFHLKQALTFCTVVAMHSIDVSRQQQTNG